MVCIRCNGKGRLGIELSDCKGCKGSGYHRNDVVRCIRCNGKGKRGIEFCECKMCNGKGYHNADVIACARCHGSGEAAGSVQLGPL